MYSNHHLSVSVPDEPFIFETCFLRLDISTNIGMPTPSLINGTTFIQRLVNISMGISYGNKNVYALLHVMWCPRTTNSQFICTVDDCCFIGDFTISSCIYRSQTRVHTTKPVKKKWFHTGVMVWDIQKKIKKDNNTMLT